MVYIVHILTLKNKERIYLINNCFIHISSDGRSQSNVNEDVEDILKKCVFKIKNIVENKDGNDIQFYYLFIRPNSSAGSIVSDDDLKVINNSVNENIEIEESNANIKYYVSTMKNDNYNADFSLVYSHEFEVGKSKSNCIII